nr:MAG TPA: hypothetical protein [Caudoviricetes sp.]
MRYCSIHKFFLVLNPKVNFTGISGTVSFLR